eukprot:Rmarinus@m.16165
MKKCRPAWSERAGVLSGGEIWAPDESSSSCFSCNIPFSFWIRKHHCRICGQIFCGSCSSGRMPVDANEYQSSERVCDDCFVPSVREVGRVPTWGGHLQLTGTNLGEDPTEILLEVNGKSVGVEVVSPQRVIRASIGSGTGANHHYRLVVPPLRASEGHWSYEPPKILTAAGPIPTCGGDVRINGLNFGENAECVTVKLWRLSCLEKASSVHTWGHNAQSPDNTSEGNVEGDFDGTESLKRSDGTRGGVGKKKDKEKAREEIMSRGSRGASAEVGHGGSASQLKRHERSASETNGHSLCEGEDGVPLRVKEMCVPHASLLCSLSPGAGCFALVVEVAGQVSSPFWCAYDPPMISSVTFSHRDPFTLEFVARGKNLGDCIADIEMRIGDAVCEVEWVENHAVVGAVVPMDALPASVRSGLQVSLWVCVRGQGVMWECHTMDFFSPTERRRSGSCVDTNSRRWSIVSAESLPEDDPSYDGGMGDCRESDEELPAPEEVAWLRDVVSGRLSAVAEDPGEECSSCSDGDGMHSSRKASRGKKRSKAARYRPEGDSNYTDTRSRTLWDRGNWEDSGDTCRACGLAFTSIRRRHHCRRCGALRCASCSRGRLHPPYGRKRERVCDDCFLAVVGKHVPRGKGSLKEHSRKEKEHSRKVLHHNRD